MTGDNNDERHALSRGWGAIYSQANFSFPSWLRTMRPVMNSLIFLAFRFIEKDAMSELNPPFSRFPSSAPNQWVESAHITPAHLHKLKPGNVIYLLPRVVPFSWLPEITANINRGYKKGLWTLERVDYTMNQFINGGPWSSVGTGGIYSFIKQCLQHLSSPESRPLKCNKAP